MAYPYPFSGAPMAPPQSGWPPMMTGAPPMYYRPGMPVPGSARPMVQPIVYVRPSPMIVVPPTKVLLPTPPPTKKIAAAAVATVYVGRIAPKIDDTFMNKILGLCGHVAKWTRISDPETQELASFGFCEYSSPQAALRALRILNDLELEGKKLLLNADKKTKETLEQYEEKLKASLIKTPIDKGDDVVLEKINQLIQQRAEEIKKAEDEADAKKEEEAEEQAKAIVDKADEQIEETKGGEKKEQGSDDEKDKKSSRSRRSTRDRSRSSDRRRDRRSRRGSSSKSRERRARERARQERLEREKRARERARKERIEKERRERERNRRKSDRRRRSRSRSASGTASDKSKSDKDSSEEAKKGSGQEQGSGAENSDQESEGRSGSEADANSEDGEEPSAKKAKAESGKGKADLFATTLDWGRIEDESLLETHVTPWVSSRLAAYFGEDSPDLVTHVLGLLRLRKSPEDVEKDLIPVLTSTAEDFTMQLWKLLVSVCK